jgi:hypothetical protein
VSGQQMAGLQALPLQHRLAEVQRPRGVRLTR